VCIVNVRPYTVVIEKLPSSNYGAYVPDLAGRIATGQTLAEVRHRISDAIEFHIEGMREEGLPIPEPTTHLAYAEADPGAMPGTQRYAILIEKMPGSNYSAYVPDLPGCVAAAETLEELQRLMEDGIRLHIQGMREGGLPIPQPTVD
jgi:predicted RNase H-like HicB family nuclease